MPYVKVWVDDQDLRRLTQEQMAPIDALLRKVKDISYLLAITDARDLLNAARKVAEKLDFDDWQVPECAADQKYRVWLASRLAEQAEAS